MGLWIKVSVRYDERFIIPQSLVAEQRLQSVSNNLHVELSRSTKSQFVQRCKFSVGRMKNFSHDLSIYCIIESIEVISAPIWTFPTFFHEGIIRKWIYSSYNSPPSARRITLPKQWVIRNVPDLVCLPDRDDIVYKRPMKFQNVVYEKRPST